MQGNNNDIIVVTDKEKTFIGKLSFWARKTEGKILNMFSRFKDFVDGNSVKQLKLEFISVSKIIWLICSPGFLSIFQMQ
jgi:hypothetical protein